MAVGSNLVSHGSHLPTVTTGMTLAETWNGARWQLTKSLNP